MKTEFRDQNKVACSDSLQRSGSSSYGHRNVVNSAAREPRKVC